MLTQKKKLEEDLERLAKTYKQLLKEQMEIQQLRNALPMIKEYYYYETELVKLPKHIPFPKQGQERLQSLKKQLLPLESEQRVLEQNKKKYIAHIKEAKAKLYVEDDLLRMKQLLEDDP